MLVALIASLATYWVSDGGVEVRFVLIGAAAGGATPWVLRRTGLR
jgi:hypothetical protein